MLSFPTPTRRDPFASRPSPFSRFGDDEELAPAVSSFTPVDESQDEALIPKPTARIAAPTAAAPIFDPTPVQKQQQTALNLTSEIPSFTAPAMAPSLKPMELPAAPVAAEPEQSQSTARLSSSVAAPQQSPTAADKAFNKPTGPATPAKQAEWSPEANKLAGDIASKHGMTTEQFMSIIRHETAGTMSASIQNSIGATGLIQFVPGTAAELLLAHKRDDAIAKANAESDPAVRKTKLEEARRQNPIFTDLSEANQSKAKKWAKDTVRDMSVEQQLALTDKYLEKNLQGKKGLDNAYTAIFAGNPNQKDFKKGSAAYENNAVLDKNKDGVITREEWMRPVTNPIHVSGFPVAENKS